MRSWFATGRQTYVPRIGQQLGHIQCRWLRCALAGRLAGERDERLKGGGRKQLRIRCNTHSSAQPVFLKDLQDPFAVPPREMR